MKKASAASLKEALQMHIEQTNGQVARLEQALEIMQAKPGRKVCDGMRGLIEEAQSELEEHDKGPLLDVVIIAAQQRMEHYEIAAYGTMATLAEAAGQKQVARLLAQTLKEEKQTDEKLTQLAEREINPTALEAAREEEEPEPASSRRGRTRRSA
jgi:ferritin-like metal-binding protein YciE